MPARPFLARMRYVTEGMSAYLISSVSGLHTSSSSVLFETVSEQHLVLSSTGHHRGGVKPHLIECLWP